MSTPIPLGVALLPVPVEHVARVAAYIAGLAGSPAGAAAAGEVVEVPNQGPWTYERLAELHDRLDYAGIVELLDQCADAPATWVPKSQAEEALGVTGIQMRNELSALSKLAKRLFGEQYWPMEWKKTKGVYFYRFDPVMARWWKQLREGGA